MPGLKFEIQRTRQYRNMSDSLKRHPQVVQLAIEAFEKLSIESKLGSIRGGTDGAMFSEKGLPTPNLSVGQHNIHSVLEFASLTEMTTAVTHAVELGAALVQRAFLMPSPKTIRFKSLRSKR